MTVAAQQVWPCQGGKPVLLGQRVADRLAGSGQRHLERQQRPTLRTALAVMAHRDPRGLVAQDDVGEGADGATRGIVGGQAAQQIDQEILAQILALAERQAQLAPKPLRRLIGLVDDGFNVVGGRVRSASLCASVIVSDEPKVPDAVGMQVGTGVG